jgi:hypothetical protein
VSRSKQERHLLCLDQAAGQTNPFVRRNRQLRVDSAISRSTPASRESSDPRERRSPRPPRKRR